MASSYLTGYEGYKRSNYGLYYEADPASAVGPSSSPNPSPTTRARSSAKKTRYGGRSYVGGGTESGSSSVSRSRTIRSGSAPDLPDLPTFKAPKVDKRKVRALTQKAAAPGIRRLRETVQQAMGQNFENPNVRRMTLREALRGYGAGLENVMSGAGRQARAENMAELDLERQEAYANFQQQTNAMMAAYNNAWTDYMKGSETVTESVGSNETGAAGASEWSRDPVSGTMGLRQKNRFATY